MWIRLLLVFCALVATVSAAESPLALKQWMDVRQQMRAARSEFSAQEVKDRAKRAQDAALHVVALVTDAKELAVGADDPVWSELLAGIRLLDPTAAEPVVTAMKDLPASGSSDKKQQKQWASAVAAKRSKIIRPTRLLGDKALDTANFSVARDCLDQILAFWPDNPELRKALQETKVGGSWYGPRDIQLASQGLAWDDKLGWILAKERERYGKGEYFDIQSKSWTTLEAANQKRSELKSQWIIQTEHLEIRGTAKLTDLVLTANLLEQFYDRVFAAYSSFFIANPKDKSNIKLLFGLLDHPRLVVNVARDVSGYRASLPPGIDAGWSAGMFIPSTKACYFYAGDSEVIYHEFTHQILDLFSDGNQGPAWLTEGAAVYTQGPVFDDGVMRLGRIGDNNGHLLAYLRQREGRNALTPRQVMNIVDGRTWSGSKEPDKNYPAAGMVVQFAMEANQRAYRADFLDFLRDCYRGADKERTMFNYLGLGEDQFMSAFEQWVATEQTQLDQVVPNKRR